MAGADGHHVDFPVGPFDLMTELERFRDMRNDVIPAAITAVMDQATEELVIPNVHMWSR